MSAPLCHRDGCTRPVNRAYGAHKPTEMGYRYIDGVRWRWFCSKACSGKFRVDGIARSPRRLDAFVAWTKEGRQRVVQDLLAACKPHLRPDGTVPVKVLAETWIEELRRQRSAAASAVIARVKRRGLELEQAS